MPDLWAVEGNAKVTEKRRTERDKRTGKEDKGRASGQEEKARTGRGGGFASFLCEKSKTITGKVDRSPP